jgi:hypothetical protein
LILTSNCSCILAHVRSLLHVAEQRKEKTPEFNGQHNEHPVATAKHVVRSRFVGYQSAGFPPALRSDKMMKLGRPVR